MLGIRGVTTKVIRIKQRPENTVQGFLCKLQEKLIMVVYLVSKTQTDVLMEQRKHPKFNFRSNGRLNILKTRR